MAVRFGRRSPAALAVASVYTHRVSARPLDPRLHLRPALCVSKRGRETEEKGVRRMECLVNRGRHARGETVFSRFVLREIALRFQYPRARGEARETEREKRSKVYRD